MAQNDWWWCHKCQGLFFAGNPGSVCPAGGEHEKPAGANSYVLLSDERASGLNPGLDNPGVWVDGGATAGVVSTGRIIGMWVQSSWPGSVALIVKASGEGKGATGVQATVDGDGQAVSGQTDAGTGVYGHSRTGRGVWGLTDSFMATVGDAQSGTGVWGHSQTGPGVHAESGSYRGIEASGKPAGHFDGDVEVTGTVIAHDVVLSNADCAEDFDVVDPEQSEPGTVMVLTPSGALEPSRAAYDTKVVGVVSGAGDYGPAVVLDRTDRPRRLPVAMVGKVYCKVDAGHGPIEVGDLLTTSPTRGHAMRAGDPVRSFGAILGKALQRYEGGQGLIPVLVGLR